MDRSPENTSQTSGSRAFPGFAAIALVFALAMGGCAVGPAKNEAGRAESDKVPMPVHEKVDVDPDVRSDFDTAMKHLKAGNYEKGIELLTRVVQRSPGHAAPYINLAMAQHKVGDLKAAEDNLKKALEIDPDHPVANNEYALICRKGGRFGESRQHYERTLRKYPGFLPARKNLGILCDLYLQDLECALTQYQAYSDAVPDDNTVRIWIADVQKRLGR